MESQVDRAGNAGDTLGGAFQVLAGGVAPGLGTISHTGLGLDARLTTALMAIPSVKGVEIGYGVRGVLAGLSGKHFHDPIVRAPGRKQITRTSNKAGGIEGGLSNGELIRLTAYVKPISTLGEPLDSIDLQSGERKPSESPRSDVCILPAAGVVGESAVLLALLELYLESFGGSTLEEMLSAHRDYLERINDRLPPVVMAPEIQPRDAEPAPEPATKPAVEPAEEVNEPGREFAAIGQDDPSTPAETPAPPESTPES
jgi:chorismate synthase